MTVCVSNAVRARLVGEYGYPEGRTITIWNGADLKHYGGWTGQRERVRAELGINDSDRVIVCVSRLVPHKRVDLVLEAMTRLRQSGSACRCLIVGGGPFEAELRQKAGDLGLAGCVTFVGHVDDVRPYLEVADLCVTASELEGLPLSLAEAMAYGLPCVATDVGGHNEIVVHGCTGLLVAPNSPEELAAAIEYLLTHEEERRAMGLAARKRVEGEFNTEETMARILAIVLDSSK